MTRVPRNRYSQLEALRTGRQKAIIVGGVPVPAGDDALPLPGAQLDGFFGADIGHKVDRQPELVRTLERQRFRNSFGDEVSLPEGVAVRLEDFESGLRAAGLMSVDQILVQSFATPGKYWVKKRNVSVDGHFGFPSVEAGAPRALPSLTEGQKPMSGRGALGQGRRAERPLTRGDGLAPALACAIKRAKRGRF